MRRGDRYVAYADQRPAYRLFIEIVRVARDGSWADIRVCSWASSWTKRQPLSEGWWRTVTPTDWTVYDLNNQEADYVAMRADLHEVGA